MKSVFASIYTAVLLTLVWVVVIFLHAKLGDVQELTRDVQEQMTRIESAALAAEERLVRIEGLAAGYAENTARTERQIGDLAASLDITRRMATFSACQSFFSFAVPIGLDPALLFEGVTNISWDVCIEEAERLGPGWLPKPATTGAVGTS